jgi:hypothetical protein
MPRPPSLFTMPDGRVLQLVDAARELGMNRQTLARHAKEWGKEAAVAMPVVRRKVALKKPVEPTPDCMQWCPEHHMALTHTEATGWVWEPFNRNCLAIAYAYARVFGCAGQIREKRIPCPQCSKEQIA